MGKFLGFFIKLHIFTVLFLNSEELLRVGTLLSEQHMRDTNDEYVDASDEEDDDNNDEEKEQEATEHWDNDLESKLENEKKLLELKMIVFKFLR